MSAPVVLKVINDTVLIKIPKSTNEYLTASGIYLSGVEHDYLNAEVIMVNQEWYDKEDNHCTADLSPGDLVVLEKNFSHRYGTDYRERNGQLKRDRIDHLVPVGDDEGFRYYLISYNDIYLKEVPDGTYGAMPSKNIKGTLFSIMQPKKVGKAKY